MSPGTSSWITGGASPERSEAWRSSTRLVPRTDDPWDERLDTQAAYDALAQITVPQRMALTLRYLDGLRVAEVAEHLGRSLHATETLLVRARAALRRVYREEQDRDV